MKQQSSRFTVPSWLKWVFLVCGALLIIGGALAIWMYVAINQDRTSGFEASAEFAVNETRIAEVDDVSLYHGKETVHIVQGTTEDGEGYIVYIDEKNEAILAEQTATNVLPIEELKQQWQQECSGCSFRKIQFAYEESHAVYEITYIDKQQRYVFNYFRLNGEPFNQKFAFKQNQ